MLREFIYMPVFMNHWIDSGLSDFQLMELEAYLCQNPESGKLIPGSGGLRKVRWAIPGKGKQGGIRVLYLDLMEFEQTFMISCYKKATIVTISQKDLNTMKQMIQQINKES
jgi:hypothetical protein